MAGIHFAARNERMTTFLIILLMLVCIFMVMGRAGASAGRGGGLFGCIRFPAADPNSAFGTKTGDVFTIVTVVAFVIFMLLSIALSFRFRNAKAKMIHAAPHHGSGLSGP